MEMGIGDEKEKQNKTRKNLNRLAWTDNSVQMSIVHCALECKECQSKKEADNILLFQEL